MTGYAVEYAGPAIESLWMAGRMTICNMTIEGGGRAGMIAPDETTFDYVEGRPGAPEDFDAAVARWQELPTEDGRRLRPGDRRRRRGDLADGHLGHEPGHGRPGDRHGSRPGRDGVPADRESAERALAYMGLAAGTPMTEIALERVFIGSCTNSRIEDLREAADGASTAARSRARSARWSSPALSRSKARPKKRASTRSSASAGFEWREAGCSMCLGMNPDTLSEGERCASTSNRNFEGRQGKGGRTHLVSPRMAAAAAVEGHFVDIRDWS